MDAIFPTVLDCDTQNVVVRRAWSRPTFGGCVFRAPALVPPTSVSKFRSRPLTAWTVNPD